MRHRVRHHVGRPVLHLGLFTDSQMLPAAAITALAAGWLYAGSGGLLVRTLVAAGMLLPVGVMVADNRVGGIVTEQARTLVRWRRDPGVFAPELEPQDLDGYLLTGEQDAPAPGGEALAHADLALAFAEDR